ncbi:MAG TPA: cupin domain-containing protein [Caulobacteraceae bacterium]|jgi:uncharacterized cupin superfamily protein|nr:cupin domain-containing protein [Caulobacteraceae bacterium]
MSRPIINIDELEFRPWDEAFPDGDKPPPEFGARKAELGAKLGARKLGYNVSAIAPGKRAFPVHNHRVNEEMFLILDGAGELVVGDERWPVRKGDVIACPPGGPETAHQLHNTSHDTELKVLSVSTSEQADVVEYPVGGKIAVGVMTPGADGKPQLMRHLFKDGAEPDYWEGETPTH